MSISGLTPGQNLLIKAAETYFRTRYGKQPKIFEKIAPELGWQPSIHFKANDYLTIAAEASETTPYPQILRIRYADILNAGMPISVYCICPEEVYLRRDAQKLVKELRFHGYGLLTLDDQGQLIRRFNCIPLVQHISESEFQEDIKQLPKNIRIRAHDAFDSYGQNPGSGVKEITIELVEALVVNAGKKVARKTWIDKNTANSGTAAKILDAMADCCQCQNARAAIGGARSYIQRYRNTSAHIPRNKEQAYRKYQDCRHGFLEGIRQITSFRDAFKNLGINVNI